MYNEDEISKQLRNFGIPIVGLGFALLQVSSYQGGAIDFLMHFSIAIIITSAYWFSCTYIVKYLWNKYPWHLAPRKHLIIEVLAINMAVALVSVLNFIAYYFAPQAHKQDEDIAWQIVIVVLLSYFLTALHEAIFFLGQWRVHFQKSQILEQSNVQAQYENLKNQLNPHFLFNSLNTLLSISEGNPNAEKYILHLADVIRYGLNPSRKEVALLTDELDVVNKFFYLQQMRFKESISLEIEWNNSIHQNVYLPPLSLQMLIENCIKHNVFSVDKPLKIRLYLSQAGYLAVENNLQKRPNSAGTGHGLHNITERYKFLSSLPVHISQTDTSFCVEIPLLHIYKNNDGSLVFT